MNTTLLALYNVYSYGIRGLHAWLKQEGYSAKSVYFKNDIYADPIYTEMELYGLLDLLAYTEPDIIAIGVHSPIFPLFVTLSKMIRQRFPKVKIVIGGDHPTGDPDSCLPYADYVVVGEPFNAFEVFIFLNFLNALDVEEPSSRVWGGQVIVGIGFL